MDSSSTAAGQEAPPGEGTLTAAAPWQPGMATTPPAAATGDRHDPTPTASDGKTRIVAPPAVVIKDATLGRAAQAGQAISASASQAVNQMSATASAATTQATRLAGSVATGASTAGAQSASALRQGVARARQFLMEKPAVLLGGAFVLGVVIARLV